MWRVLDVSGWGAEQPEPRGKRAKMWIRDEAGAVWLRKTPHRFPEIAVEWVALRLARHAGLRAAEAQPCVWQVTAGAERGLAVRTFVDQGLGASLEAGVNVLRRVDASYDPEDRGLHSIERVFTALERLESGMGTLTAPFLEMLLFDAWLGNRDRHQENWSLLSAPGMPLQLAPLYDPAACLGSELLDGHVLLQVQEPSERLRNYVAKCSSGFGPARRRAAADAAIRG